MDLRLSLFISLVFAAAGAVTLWACGSDVYHQVGECVPECEAVDRVCGSDGCGGVCGTCAEGESCSFEGRCEAEACIPECTLAECGDDGCGTQCGTCAAPTPLCSPQRRCVDCLPDCTNRVCGDDGCGGSCGVCDADFVCDTTGNCCQPFCEGRVCGGDGCGGSCGTCTGTTACNEDSGTCI